MRTYTDPHIHKRAHTHGGDGARFNASLSIAFRFMVVIPNPVWPRQSILTYSDIITYQLRMALIRHHFPELRENDHEEMLSRLLATAKTKTIIQRPVMQEALEQMKHEDPSDFLRDFEGLAEKLADQKREELIRNRLCAPRAAAEFHTPVVLKKLRPKPGVGACVLTFQVPTNSFQGYYPRVLTPEQEKSKRVKKHFSISRTFGERWSQTQALSQVVGFLWGCHKKAGGEPASVAFKLNRKQTSGHYIVVVQARTYSLIQTFENTPDLT